MAAKDLEGKVITIIGANSFVGALTAKYLASKGAILALADTDKMGLQELEASLPHCCSQGRHQYRVVDMQDPEAVTSWIRRISFKYNGIDGAVNATTLNLTPKKIILLSDEAWDEPFAAMVKGGFNCLRPQLWSVKKGGSIVNVVDARAEEDVRHCPAFRSSSAAAVELIRAAAEQHPDLRVNCISMLGLEPSFSLPQVKAGSTTEKAGEIDQPRRMLYPIEVVRTIALLLSNDAARITGAIYNIEGGIFL